MRVARVVFLSAVSCSLFVTGAWAGRWPLNSWNVGCNGFWSTCVRPYHTGVDASGAGGTTVYAPFSGTIREARYHSGYGGTILEECRVAGETVTIVLGHNDGNTFAVREGQQVNEGAYLCRLAYYGYWSGYYSSHCHCGIRAGGDKSGIGCDRRSPLPIFPP